MGTQKGFTHLTYTDRVKIEALRSAGASISAVAAYVGKSRATIYNELHRGAYMRMTSELTFYRAYSADIAQKDYDYKATAKGADLKISNDHKLADYLEQKIIQENYSPCAAIEDAKKAKKKFKTMICFKTLYNYIDKEIFLNLTNKQLLRKKNPTHHYQKIHRIHVKRPLCRTIDQRPEEIALRKDYDHWEMDTVIGKAKGKGAALLVLTERKSRQELLFKLAAKTEREVIKVLNRLERKYGSKFKQIFKTITVDNGSEFLDTEGMEKSCRTKGKRTTIYYCHPFSSWERGSNENANAIIRRFIPKGTPIENYSDAEIKRIEHWMNNYPRRILNYQCANDLIPECFKTA